MPRNLNFDKYQIWSKGIDIFIKNGFSGTSVEILTQGLSLNRSSLYNSFGSKGEFYNGVINYSIDRLGEVKISIGSELADNKSFISKITSREFVFLLYAIIESKYPCIPHNDKLQKFWSELLSKNGFIITNLQASAETSREMPIERILITLLFKHLFVSHSLNTI